MSNHSDIVRVEEGDHPPESGDAQILGAALLNLISILLLVGLISGIANLFRR